jgi:bilin biosynthesis protein
MDQRFFKLFNLTEDEAIAILDTPLDLLGENDSRYIAASHLVNFSTDRSISALIRAVQNTDSSLENRIVRRKSIETLGRLQATSTLSVIRACLADDDCYTVENAVWAIGEIGTQDGDILEEMVQLLDKPEQTYRVILHTLAKLNDKTIASAAIAAICRLTGDTTQMEQAIAFLQHPNVYVRRLCIQDFIDTQYYDAIARIAGCPVSLVFRLRGIRSLAEASQRDGSIDIEEILSLIDRVIRDLPADLDLVHEYDQFPVLDFVVRELYQTDFGRCYLASKTLLDAYAAEAPAALMQTYQEEAHNDYGAHYHVIKVLGWLKYTPAYDLFVEALYNREPQFQKSRAAAAIALGELGDIRAIGDLKACLETPIWDLKYAALMALEQLGDSSGCEIAANDADWLVRAKAKIVNS